LEKKEPYGKLNKSIYGVVTREKSIFGAVVGEQSIYGAVAGELSSLEEFSSVLRHCFIFFSLIH